ncbi:uncharacterized protein LOC131675993 [Topomyia yanbarensis]|uniref:uncharacterized protein LOC131675993 n=1 Tax=Topomyia yanbarensis TaxID=2498891 RepID=UPI00273B3FF9|nr:uncharacterized protein LOC131675993 [Topomyia yanbarensis]
MNRLQERQELEKKKLELDLQQKFLNEKTQLSDSMIAEESRSQQSRVSYRASLERVRAWVEEGANSEEGAVGGVPKISVAPQSKRPITGIVHHDSTMNHGQKNSAPTQDMLIDVAQRLNECMLFLSGMQLTESTPAKEHHTEAVNKLNPQSQMKSLGAIPKARTNANNSNAFQQQCKGHARVVEDIPEQCRSLSGTNHTDHSSQLNCTSNQFPPTNVGPTQQQLSARQSLARDLPSFSGDPSEWPIFISNYNYTTEACGYTHGENLIRLQRCLKGHALDTVRSRLVLPGAVPHIIETLRMRFGRPEVLINSLLLKVRSFSAPRADRLESLIEYGMAIQALCDHIEAADEHAHLSNPMLLQELIGKLPADQKLMWAGYKRGMSNVNLKTFCDYMNGVVQDASSVVLFEPDKRAIVKERLNPRGWSNAHLPSTNERLFVPENIKQHDCLMCSKPGHRLRDCNDFKDLDMNERWYKVRELGLCQNCLFGHGRRSCRNSSWCNIDGCQYRHHPLLHSVRKVETISTTGIAENHTHRYLESSLLFRIIPVTIYGKSGTLDIFAFLDEGSSLTLLDEDVAAKHGIHGSVQPLCLHWTENTSRLEKNSRSLSFEISGVAQGRRYKIEDARTVNNLNLPNQNFHKEEAAKRFEHLKQIPLQSYKNVSPKLLIGIDNLRLALPLKVREGDGSGPTAVKTRLGWCVYGRQRDVFSKAYNLHACNCTTNSELHDVMKQFFAAEQETVTPATIVMSVEDQRAQQLLESTTQRVGNRFETGMLWKQDNITLPDSSPMAFYRLKCLERRMHRKPDLKENLHRQIRDYKDKGYANLVTTEELAQAHPERIWYLPLGVVFNAKKPGKLRVIWDAAAKVDGVSLNSVLLKGPDQLASLPGIVLRFRQYKVAVSADIQEMFHQVRIRQADKHSQRFLWRDDPSLKPDVYMMDVATFGATCSPASAHFIKNLNAEEHSKLYPRAARGIIDSHYVDDYLDSFGSDEEAKQVAEEIRLVHRNGGFTLRGWRSNSDQVLDYLEEANSGSYKNLNIRDNERTERVLGMLWTPLQDELHFSTQMSEEVQMLIHSNNRPTKRQILRCVMTMFDPLGLMAPFLIHGKVLMQSLWRTGADWDDKVDDNAFEFWSRWVKMIEFISTVRIPRCYFHEASVETYTNAQLHMFADASETAYACAVYLWTMDNNGNPQCALVAGKAKVAPVKPMSVLRLELQGCVLGVRLMKFVQDSLSVPIVKRTLWTDSTTALSWIQADPRNYRPFVAHRVGEILESTSVDEWSQSQTRPMKQPSGEVARTLTKKASGLEDRTCYISRRTSGLVQ